jgi:vitamin B12 transporter
VIKRHRFICLLGIAAFSALPAFSQVATGDTAQILLNEVTISATRIPENTKQFSRIARIISRREIESLPVRDLAELLKYIPDIDVRQRGPIGVQSDISLRGGTFDQFVVLINGINFSDPQTGHFQIDIPIPLSMIQRIEVLSGSDVKSLGSNAFAGAINIVTEAPRHRSIGVGLSGGKHGYLEAGIDARNRSGNWWQQFGALFLKSDGYRENTDFRNLKGVFQTGYGYNRFNFSLMAGGLRKAFGANSFYTAKYPNQFEKTGSGFTAIQADLKGRVNIRQSIYYRFHTDEFSLFRTNPPEWYKSPNYHLSQVAGSKTDAWFSTPLGKTAFGFEFRHESVWSTLLGELSETLKPVYRKADANYTHFGSRDHFSLSAEQQVVKGRFKWNGGVVLHKVLSVKNFLQIYPGLDISYSANKNLRTYLSFNRAFRLPTFTELYYTSPTNQGNANLFPETAWHAETGTEYNRNGFSAMLIGFFRFASQSIDWVRAENETLWHTENLGQILTYGMESGISLIPAQQPWLAKVIDRFDLGYRHYFQHHTAYPYDSQYVLDYLKWKLTTGITLKMGNRIRFTATLVWSERNGTYTSFDTDQNMVEIDYKPFMVMDVKLLYQSRWFRLIAECTNIFNTEYVDLGSIPQPGAWVKFGVEINLVQKH